MPSLAASVKTSVPRVAHKSAMCLRNSQAFGSGISGKYEAQGGNDWRTFDELVFRRLQRMAHEGMRKDGEDKRRGFAVVSIA